MVLLITIVFNFFLVLLWKIFFCCETFSFGGRHILYHSLWDIFFWSETFFFPARLFLSLWDFFFWCKTFSFLVRMFRLQIILLQVSTSGEQYKRFCRLYSLSLVLWGKHIYRIEKGRRLESKKALVDCVACD